MSLGARLEREIITPQYGLALHGPILLQLWERATPDEGAREAVALAARLAETSEPAVATLVIVAEESSLPSSAARDILATLPGALGRGVGIALVREGSGFRSAAVRAVLTGLMLVSRSRMAQEV